MAEEKRHRAGLRGARTRERNVDLYGASVRRTAREVENERVERGQRTLAEQYSNVPSRGDFLHRAELFERAPGSAKVTRAFIVPQTLRAYLDANETTVQVYWYISSGVVALLGKDDEISVVGRDNTEYRIRFLENMTGARATTDGAKRARTCTGVVLCVINRGARKKLTGA
jgi:hypothetical protein